MRCPVTKQLRVLALVPVLVDRESAGRLCPFCDGPKTWWRGNDATYALECDDCGHEWDER